MTTHELKTHKKSVFINITRDVKEAVRKSGVNDGTVTVYCPHTTAGITINENADPDVCLDMTAGLNEMVPAMDFRHAEGNSAAHIKASMMGAFAVVPVNGGELAMGIWQAIYFCEFDGPRSRRFFVTVNGR